VEHGRQVMAWGAENGEPARTAQTASWRVAHQ
jgi:hypothetical protein